jgi:hypothetical protein
MYRLRSKSGRAGWLFALIVIWVFAGAACGLSAALFEWVWVKGVGAGVG